MKAASLKINSIWSSRWRITWEKGGPTDYVEQGIVSEPNYYICFMYE